MGLFFSWTEISELIGVGSWKLSSFGGKKLISLGSAIESTVCPTSDNVTKNTSNIISGAQLSFKSRRLKKRRKRYKYYLKIDSVT